MSDQVTFLEAQVLHNLACRAYERAAGATSPDHTLAEDAITAIVLSAASLEAFLNELVHVAAGDQDGPESLDLFVDLLTEMDERRASIRSRFYVARYLFPGPNFDKGRQPYQNIDLLFAIRDHILHSRPERVPVDASPRTRLLDRLISCGLLDRPNFIASTLFWLQTPKVALWACNVVPDVIAHFRLQVPPDDAKPSRTIRWLWFREFRRLATEDQ